jgi:hypothetical protein
MFTFPSLNLLIQPNNSETQVWLRLCVLNYLWLCKLSVGSSTPCLDGGEGANQATLPSCWSTTNKQKELSLQCAWQNARIAAREKRSSREITELTFQKR